MLWIMVNLDSFRTCHGRLSIHIIIAYSTAIWAHRYPKYPHLLPDFLVHHMAQYEALRKFIPPVSHHEGPLDKRCWTDDGIAYYQHHHPDKIYSCTPSTRPTDCSTVFQQYSKRYQRLLHYPSFTNRPHQIQNPPRCERWQYSRRNHSRNRYHNNHRA